MHKAKACVLTCIDFRFQDSIQSWLKEKHYLGAADEIVVAGASRDLVKPLEKFHQQALMRQIELSVQLHDPDEIVIIDHQDCGGYAQDGTIPNGLSKTEDKSQHHHWSEILVKLLQQKFPQKKILSYYATLEGQIEEL